MGENTAILASRCQREGRSVPRRMCCTRADALSAMEWRKGRMRQSPETPETPPAFMLVKPAEV